jgi:hypothetical protein
MNPSQPWTPTVTTTPAFFQGPVVLYPNPVKTGNTVMLQLPLQRVSDVKIQIFTLAFRKVQDQTFPQVSPGVELAVDLADKWGSRLANGLYYLVVTTNQGRSIEKLLVLR